MSVHICMHDYEIRNLLKKKLLFSKFCSFHRYLIFYMATRCCNSSILNECWLNMVILNMLPVWNIIKVIFSNWKPTSSSRNALHILFPEHLKCVSSKWIKVLTRNPMTFALHKVSIAVIKHCHQEQLGGGKCFFFHLSSHKLFTEGTWEKI